MARVVLFSLLLVTMLLAAPPEKSVKVDKADTAAQITKVAKPDKANKLDPAAKVDKAEKIAPAEKAAPLDKSDPQYAYEVLLRQRAQLEQQKKVLEYEEGLAEASLLDSAAYLVVDLDRQIITAKLGGVPMRDAPILWRYERPGQAAVSGIFQVAERVDEVPVPDSAVADSARIPLHLAVVAADSARADSTHADTLAVTPRGPAPRHYDPQKRFRISLQGGPDLWLATLPPTQTRMDSLEVRLHLWIRDFPAVVQHRQSIHLFLAPADSYWIYAMAVLGARVLVIPPS